MVPSTHSAPTAESVSTLTVDMKKIELAFAACRSIRFAVINAGRHGGEWSLNDLLAANRLARQALEGVPETLNDPLKPRRTEKRPAVVKKVSKRGGGR